MFSLSLCLHHTFTDSPSLPLSLSLSLSLSLTLSFPLSLSHTHTQHRTTKDSATPGVCDPAIDNLFPLDVAVYIRLCSSDLRSAQWTTDHVPHFTAATLLSRGV